MNPSNSPYLENLRVLLHAAADETMVARPATAMIRAKLGRCLAILGEAAEEFDALKRERGRFRRRLEGDAIAAHDTKHRDLLAEGLRVDFEVCRQKSCIEARNFLRERDQEGK